LAIFIDLDAPPKALRQALYEGNLVILTRLKAVSDLVEYTQQELAKLFRPHDPEWAHLHYDKAEMARMLGEWKPRYIHSEASKRLVCEVVEEAGFPSEDTYYDVPRPRTSFPVGHLTTGIAFAFPWHRDVWYSAPAQQINWWLPIYPVTVDNAMSFDLRSFDRAVRNSSHEFDYYRNNIARLTTATQIVDEKQSRPAALEYEPIDELVVLPAPGEVLVFSGAQLHKSIPNTSSRSRFSVDFRTIDLSDLGADRGAPLVDVHCTGTTVRDFHNLADGRSVDEVTVRQLFGEPPPDSMLVFNSPAQQPAGSSAGGPSL
jgi:Phytanoyl-CoA dioxygenase (PhyH)